MKGGDADEYRCTDSSGDERQSSPWVPLSNTAGDGRWTDGDPFLHVEAAYFWSATESVEGPGRALVMNLHCGRPFTDDKNVDYFVWPVRGSR